MGKGRDFQKAAIRSLINRRTHETIRGEAPGLFPRKPFKPKPSKAALRELAEKAIEEFRKKGL